MMTELRRFFAAILLLGALLALAAAVAGCEADVRAVVVLKDGTRAACPSGIFWATGDAQILCRTAPKDAGFIVRGVAMAEIDYIDVRP